MSPNSPGAAACDPDTPVVIDVLRTDYDHQTSQPRAQQQLLSDATATLFVNLDHAGALWLRYVSGCELVSLHLPAGLAQALVYACYEWFSEIEMWQEAQAKHPRCTNCYAPATTSVDGLPFCDAHKAAAIPF